MGYDIHLTNISKNEHRRASVRPPRNPTELGKLEKSSTIARLQAIKSGHKIDLNSIEIIQKKDFRNHKQRLISSEALHMIKWNRNCLNRNDDGLKQNLTWL
ncbi:unnamed protein product [Trichobilharzia regenti]|nr:unnamed protein product [Trichobilharzia regenti]